MPNRMVVLEKLARLSGALAVFMALLALSPAAQARSDANPVLTVTFTISGQISFTAPDGTPLGTSSGTPTQIPAGYYTVQMNGPGGCSNIPYFDMNGPGVNVAENLLEGELASWQFNTYLAPNSTYTWHNVDAVPPTTFTFTTSSTVVGSLPAQAGPKGLSAADHGTAQSVNIFATSSSTPLRGKLTGVVSAGGKLSLSFDGKSVAKLKPRSRVPSIAVTDKSTSSGFMLVNKGKALSVTGGSFVGTKKLSVKLTTGKWLFAPSLGGKQSYSDRRHLASRLTGSRSALARAACSRRPASRR